MPCWTTHQQPCRETDTPVCSPSQLDDRQEFLSQALITNSPTAWTLLMNIHTTSLSALLAATFALTASTAFAQVEIDPARPVGATVRYFAWDLKGWKDVANSPERAQKLYGETPEGPRGVCAPIQVIARQSTTTNSAAQRRDWASVMSASRWVCVLGPSRLASISNENALASSRSFAVGGRPKAESQA